MNDIGEIGNRLNPGHRLDDDRLLYFTEQLPVGVLIVDDAGFIVTANLYALKLFLYDEASLVGKNIDRLVPSSSRRYHSKLRADYLKSPLPRRMMETADNLKGLRSDGSEVFLEIGLAPLVLDQCRHTLVTVLDVSERRRLLDDLKDSEERLQSITNHLPVGVLLVDESGVVVSANLQIQEMFGYKNSELMGARVDVLVPDAIQSRHVQLRESYQRAPKPRRMAEETDFLKGRRQDGSEVPLEIGLAPISLNGKLHTLATLLDISERQRLVDDLKYKNLLMDQAIAKLTESNEQLERFAFICSHDLQEPVRMVQSFSQLLEKRLGDKLDGKDKEYLDFITDGAQRARDMISDILLFCRLDKPTDRHENVSLSEVCEQVNQTLQGGTSFGGSFQWPDTLPELTAIRSQLFQVLLNLVSNGLKFNHSDCPVVVLSVEDNGEKWRINVRDNGIGIAPRFQEQVFQIFERLHSKKDFPGTGIGLAICQKIAAQHHAELNVASVEGEGSCFSLDWPKDINSQLISASVPEA